MDENAIWKVLCQQYEVWVPEMIRQQKGTWVDLHWTPSTQTLGTTGGPGTVRIASVTGMDDRDLEACIGLVHRGDLYDNQDGQVFPTEGLLDYVMAYMRDLIAYGDAEWAWALRVHPSAG